MQQNTSSAAEYTKSRQNHWDEIARKESKKSLAGRYYHRRIRTVYKHLINEGLDVLELGCGEGDLLASLQPAYGLGIDFSEGMIRKARDKHPHLSFQHTDVHNLDLNRSFDVIILSDLLNDLWDVQTLFELINTISTPRTLILINEYSRVWEIPLQIARRMRLASRKLPQNWLTPNDIKALLSLSGLSMFRHWQEILFPFPIPLLSGFLNCFMARLWPFNLFGLTNFIIARKDQLPKPAEKEPKVSIVIPARNEEGNIFDIIKRTPEIGESTELIFVEGHSSDETYETIQKAIAANPGKNIVAFQQQGDGKGDAVRLGFEKASGDILMILDADMTVPPETLPRFYNAIIHNENTLVSGSRLIYPMEKKAMRFMNMLGNKFFSLLFTWLIDQPIKDTLCGTKVLWKEDYEKIAANRHYFGKLDPFGDFDLLFGAARLNMQILEIPIRYAERTYGDTNIERWTHGLLLLRMAWQAALKLKFI